MPQEQVFATSCFEVCEVKKVVKKVVGKIGFILLCIVLFLIAAAISLLVLLSHKVEAPYRYLKVNDSSRYTVEYDLDTDGRETTKYDLYLPANADTSKNYSLIFYIHGGGFTGGDKADGKYWCPYYASKGMVAVSVNYTLSKGDGVANLNTMFAELRNTIQVVIDDCARRGYSITEMATTGGSAGGCLAMLVAYREPETLPIPIRFVFEQTGPASFEPDGWGQTENAGRAAFVSMMTGKTFTAEDVGTDAYQQAIDEISPAALVNQSSIPTILAYGPKDKVVPPDIKYRLIEKLDEYGVVYDYIEFPHSGHGLLDDLDKSEEFYKLSDLYMERYFENQQ